MASDLARTARCAGTKTNLRGLCSTIESDPIPLVRHAHGKADEAAGPLLISRVSYLRRRGVAGACRRPHDRANDRDYRGCRSDRSRSARRLRHGGCPWREQRRVAREERANRFLLLVSNRHGAALPIHSEVEVYSSFLEATRAVKFIPRQRWGVYLYLLEGGPVLLNERRLETLGAALVTKEKELVVSAELDAELLLVHVQLT